MERFQKGTPDTQPSLAVTSPGSSIGGDPSRVLFGSPGTVVDGSPFRIGASASAYAADSDASVASLTLTEFIDQSRLTDLQSEFSETILTSDDQSIFPRVVPKSMTGGDDDKENVPHDPTCYTGLPSPKFADLFALFEGSRKRFSRQSDESVVLRDRTPPSNSSDVVANSDTHTEVTSNTAPSLLVRSPQIESLYHEIEALKQIIRSDSVCILNLKTEIEANRIERKSLDHEAALIKAELELVKRQRDNQRVRESQRDEAFKILKAELDGLTSGEDDIITRKDMDQMKLENELLASQILEYETEIAQLQSRLELVQPETASGEKDSSAPNIRSADKDLTEEPSSQAELESDEPFKDEIADSSVAASTAQMISEKMLLYETRLKTFEMERDNMLASLEEEKRCRERDIEKIRLLLAAKGVSTSIETGWSDEGVEVPLDETLASIDEVHEPAVADEATETKSTERSGSWSSVCDCFVPTSTTD